VDASVLEAVPGASRDEDEIARADYEGAYPVEDLELAEENIEGFVGSGVDMGDRTFACGNMEGSACAVSRVLCVVELLSRERHVWLLRGLRAKRGERARRRY
jgi:hypothetical protein